MKFGFAEREITPDLIQMAGYAVDERIATGTRDPLYVKVAVFRNEMTLVLFSLDILAVEKDLQEGAETFVQKELPGAETIVMATHTHSGPAGLWDTTGHLRVAQSFMGTKDEALLTTVLIRMESAFKEAVKNLEKVSIYQADGICEGISKNRNDETALGDDRLHIIELDGKEKKTLLVNYACHPTVLGPENLRWSADFPGEMAKALAEKGYDQVMFINGPAGDLSTRYTRTEKPEEDVVRFGQKLADAVLETLENKKWIQPTLQVRSFEKKVQARKPNAAHNENDLKRAQVALEWAYKHETDPKSIRKAEVAVESLEAERRYLEAGYEAESYQLPITEILVGEQRYYTVPGELFSKLSNSYRKMARFVGYAKGYYLYFANEEAFDEGVYEAMSSLVARGEAERVLEELEELNE